MNQQSPVIFIPHGGGPLPLLGDPRHLKLIDFLKSIRSRFVTPSKILIISAHWEAETVSITSGETPSLIYDYYGFPDAAYDIEYPVPGDPLLANRIYDVLQQQGISATLDAQRGFDHGVFVPLKLMYPEANIPCVQLSLVKSLDPAMHIQIGKALSELRNENLLIIGSGFSFHNLTAFFKPAASEPDPANVAFESWLTETCCRNGMSDSEREQRLIDWKQAPSANYCHPREEHLLPLHVCYGIAGGAAKRIFYDTVSGKLASAFLW